MSTDIRPPEDTYFLQGNRKAWFRVSVGLLIFLFILPIVSAVINRLIMSRTNSLIELITGPFPFLDGIQDLISAAAWFTILLAYGLNNRVKVFNLMFLILASTQLFFAINELAASGLLRHIFQPQGGSVPVIGIITGVIIFLRYIIWIVFMVIILSHAKSSRPLKISAAIMLVSQVFGIVYSLGSGFLYQGLLRNMSESMVFLFLGLVVMSIINTAPMIYLLWAMSFSMMKGDAVKTAAA